MARRSGHQMIASLTATLIAAPALPSMGMSAAPAHSCTNSATALQRTTSASPPDAYRNTFRPELLNDGIKPAPIHNSAGAAGMNAAP